MAVLRQGSRGSGVTELQQALNDAGYTPPLKTDSIFGPLTKAAVDWYQTENNLDVDGVAGTEFMASIGLGDTGDSPASDFTDDEQTRFNGLPGEPEIWKDKDSGKSYAVYYVPDS